MRYHSQSESEAIRRPVQLATFCSLATFFLFAAVVRVTPAGAALEVESAVEIMFVQDNDERSVESGDSNNEDFAVEGRTVVSGTLRDEKGNPVAGATVYLLEISGKSRILPTHPNSTSSDTNGLYKFTGVQSGKYRIWAENEALTSLTEKLGGQPLEVKADSIGMSTLDLELHQGCEYDVLVQSKDGQPIEGAKISFGWTDIDRQYFTGADGVARIKGLSVDDWYFIICAEGYATQFKRTSKQTLGTREELEFDLEPGCGVRVRLADQDGNPVAGAKFYLLDGEMSMSPNYAIVKTDAQGRFEVDGLPPNRKFRMSARIDGFQVPSYSELTPAAGEVQEINLSCEKLPYGGDIVFTVVDDQGAPVPDAEITNMGRSSSLVRKVTTDEDGKALMENLYARSRGCQVKVVAPNMIIQSIKVTPGTRKNPAEEEIQLTRGGTLRGIIVDRDRNRVPNVRVYYNDGHRGFNETGGVTKADDKGRFQISGLPEDSTLTVYTPKGFAPLEGLPVVIPREEVTKMAIELSPEAVIRARAFDAETGERITDFNIKINGPDERREGDVVSHGISSSLINPGINVHGTQTEYLLDHEVPGVPYKLTVSADGYETRVIPRAETALREHAVVLGIELKPRKSD